LRGTPAGASIQEDRMNESLAKRKRKRGTGRWRSPVQKVQGTDRTERRMLQCKLRDVMSTPHAVRHSPSPARSQRIFRRTRAPVPTSAPHAAMPLQRPAHSPRIYGRICRRPPKPCPVNTSWSKPREASPPPLDQKIQRRRDSSENITCITLPPYSRPPPRPRTGGAGAALRPRRALRPRLRPRLPTPQAPLYL